MLRRKISYENWAREKQLELQSRRDVERLIEKERRKLEEFRLREKEEQERRDDECFVEWLKRKRKEKLLKRQLLEKELDLQRRIQDVDDKAKVVKDVYIKGWLREKEEQLKGESLDTPGFSNFSRVRFRRWV